MTVTESSGLHFAWLRQPHLEEDVVFTAASVLHDSGFSSVSASLCRQFLIPGPRSLCPISYPKCCGSSLFIV